MKIRDLYTPGAVVAELDDTLAEAADTLRAGRIGALAVLHEGELVGIISERDLVRAMADRVNPQETLVRRYYTSHAVWLPADADPDDAAELMSRLGVRHLPVMDHGQLAGFVSATDLLRIWGARSAV